LKKSFIILVMLGLFLATTVNFAVEGATVYIAGSTSMQPLVEELAQAFMTVNTGVKISVQSGGSGAGVESVRKGTADIGMCSRELKPEEEVLYRTLIAKDGIAVIVNSSNTNGQL
jgi:phosphate transport system substrate-binding protein